MLALLKSLEKSRALTGKELQEITGIETFDLWRACKSLEIELKSIAKHYLRLDRKIPGYVRLSPSIQREFLTYTIVGVDKEKVEERSEELKKEIVNISQRKLLLAKKFVESFTDKACYIIGGDVVFDMAHSEPRPERSTGELVRGSDLDIIVIVEDDYDFKPLDKAIHDKKYLFLKTYREEVDYIVKNISKVRKQVKFESFEDKVACKILTEGKFLYGNKEIYKEVKNLLRENKIPEKINKLEQKARKFREEIEKMLLTKEKISESDYIYFLTTEEESEIF